MSSRFTLGHEPSNLASQLNLPGLQPPRQGTSSSQRVLIVRAGPNGREAAYVQRGLIPPWATDPEHGYVNARAETAATRPAFGDAFRNSRCLVPADGFYLGKHHLHLHGNRLFAFAGLWRRWQGPDGQTIDSCTILITEANELIRPINPRMPVILDREDFEPWLDPGVTDPRRLRPLLKPYPPEKMVAEPVERKGKRSKKDDPATTTEQPTLF
jgi:putative SOS response-associated peptidase YedK